MKILKSFLLLCPVAIFASCGSAERQTTPLRPVKVSAVESLGLSEKSFSGVVMPDQYSDLAFKVGGPLVQLSVVEGQHVRRGDIVAQIDPIDYRLQFEAKRSSYLTAKSQLERAEKLLARDAISRQDHETMQANFDNARAAFETAQSQLAETKLRAPFDGFVQKKYVENYQKVQPGTSIVCLVDPTALKIRFTMPENNLEFFLSNPDLFIEFENYKGTSFRAKVKEYIPASNDGSGIPVFLGIDDKRFNLQEFNVAVGFTCRVILRHGNPTQTNACVVPIASIVAVEGSHSEHLYIYNPADSAVHLRKVVTGGVTGRGNVIITDGLSVGEQVVVAGATRLVDGRRVKVLNQ